jgi:AraC family transcriptional regulator of adaptative response/methylated-DNA-[protein]-cysteine methyltransferase
METNYQRISQAIEFISSQVTRQPSLDEIAGAVGLSPDHFQRVFKEWVGISPKRFLQYLTIGYAKQVLDESRSVLEASFSAGLSGPGRLHDLFINIEAMTPGEYKQKGWPLTIKYGYQDTPFGTALIGQTSRGICWWSFQDGGQPGNAFMEMQERWPGAVFENDDMAVGETAEVVFKKNEKSPNKITLLVQGTNFQIKVWDALLYIPPSRLVTYGDLARWIGHPASGRAVGNAVGANPVSLLIPCHRVIRSLGETGNYHWGALRKKAMIAWEAARENV